MGLGRPNWENLIPPRIVFILPRYSLVLPFVIKSNIMDFKEVLPTPSHLAIVMEYAAVGELFERICTAGRFSEDEARFFFQQLISGFSYCHSMQICHGDLKLENTLLDGTSTPRLKICDFGYSNFGTPAYIAPEMLSKKQYAGKIADVWSCGVTLYLMLVGAYASSKIQETSERQFRYLLSRIFVADPGKRITIMEIKTHPWFTKNLSSEFASVGDTDSLKHDANSLPRDVDEIVRIIQEPRNPGDGPKLGGHLAGESLDLDDMETDADIDVESSETLCARYDQPRNRYFLRRTIPLHPP